MRLIDSTTLELKVFTASKVPPYAILSHTWDGQNEISFQAMQSLTLLKPELEIDPGGKVAGAKIKGCCQAAIKDGIDYVWIDTCCIDKTSSSELSEAINSMYRWYQQAEVCYVYLLDVDSGFDSDSFLKSRWFERGWTLQELIAPSSLIFFDKAWEEIGTKSSLYEYISQKTGIPPSLLLGLEGPETFSIAQRMSWASNRETTRVEDVAYCLMGVFGINMPMLYGEGHQAFIRLQEEIIKTSDDQSVFAWKSDRWEDKGGGLLASSPAAFSQSGDIIRSSLQNSMAFVMTSNGLSVKVPMTEVCDGEIIDPEIEVDFSFTGVLNCERMDDSSYVLGISFKRFPGTSKTFSRFNSNFLEKVDKSEVDCSQSKFSDVYVKQERRQDEVSTYKTCYFEISGLEEYGFSLKEHYPKHHEEWDRKFSLFSIQHRNAYEPNVYQAVRFANPKGAEFVVLLEWKGKSHCIDIVSPSAKSATLQEIIRPLLGKQQKKPTDRMIWQHPKEKWHIFVAVKRKIVANERLLVVNVSIGNITLKTSRKNLKRPLSVAFSTSSNVARFN